MNKPAPVNVLEFLDDEENANAEALAPAPHKAAAADEDGEEDAPAPAAKAVKVPKTSKALTALTLEEMNAIVEQQNLGIPNWEGMALSHKKTALATALGLTKPKANKSGINDPMSQAAFDIEQLTDQEDIEKEIEVLVHNEGLNDFKLGGLLQKLSESAVFSESLAFRDYVEERFGVKYRKVRYLIQIYNCLINADISWDVVSELGWTKLQILSPILTNENVAEWAEKAAAVNCPTLTAMVKAAMQVVEPGEKQEEVKNFKTKSFKLFDDQAALVDDALADSMAKSGTQVPGVALEYICNEYLNSTGKTKGVTPSEYNALKDKLQKTEAELQAAVGLGATVPLATVYKSALEKAGGDVEAALGELFGEAFDEVFPGLLVDVKPIDAED